MKNHPFLEAWEYHPRGKISRWKELKEEKVSFSHNLN